MSESCLFCKIVAGQIPAQKVYEDEQICAFRDIHPKAETHLLVIPNKHIASLTDLQPEDSALMGYLTLQLPKLAAQQGLTHGFRTIINTGRGGGQEVFHIHYHLLGGQRLPGFH